MSAVVDLPVRPVAVPDRYARFRLFWARQAGNGGVLREVEGRVYYGGPGIVGPVPRGLSILTMGNRQERRR